ncbi:alpha/beta fold hydrolase [Methylocapsa palsarum]|uniref:Pimeloyl-ACP methyl ester carboxylesterase n=1 Tax=Methylocapsa palsarum TaxID=1612308 RepID=A0A1I4B310_9HYPH|nr:alpha/beta hydrolase [Methylocapsa palsarum]SFK62276.1 Pimeloyl-ACP methyl ester carboxylesterase [Methylocapsa palsarum]
MIIPELPFKSRFVSACDGLPLHVRDYGSALDRGVPVVCLPGLTRTSSDFGPLASAMTAGLFGAPRRVLALDYRGRGDSGYDRDWRNYSLEIENGDILSVLTALGIERAIFIGTSRGGLHAMLLSASRPCTLHAVVLNDIGPVLEPIGIARIRGYAGKTPAPRSIPDAIDLLKHLMSEHFSGLSEEEWRIYARMTFCDASGRLAPRYDPRLVKPFDSLDLEQPLPDLWAQFDGLRDTPLLIIRAKNSDLLSPETLAAMEKRRRRCEILIVPGQGHPALLIDRTSIARICEFIARVDPTPPEPADGARKNLS